MSQQSDSESRDSDEGIRYKTDSTRNLSSEIGPQLPPPLLKQESTFGPQLPPHLLKKETLSSIGPQLPPHLQKSEESENIGPELPSHLKKEEADQDSICIGPQLPPHLRQKLQQEADEESDEEIFGPLPAGSSAYSKSQVALEERALQLKLGYLEPDTNKTKVREEWMLELPEVKAAKFGLGPRQFRSKPGPDLSNRSSWTDTPDKKEDKTEKVDLKAEAESKEIRRRDQEQEKMAKKHKRKNESLLEMHQSKMKEKKKDEGPNERRPFSREVDLQVNRFDEAQKKAVLKKAQLLDDRFSSGQSKFL